MKSSTLFFFFVFFLFPFLHAQENKKLDSLLKVYNTLPNNSVKVQTARAIFIETRRSDPSRAIQYLHKSLNISKKIKSEEDEGIAYRDLGLYYKNYYNPDSVVYYFHKSNELFKALNDKKQLFNTLHEWARFENLEGNFTKAINLSDKSILLAEELQIGEMLSDALQRKATIFLDKGEYKKAIENLLNASRVLDTLNPKIPLKEAIVKIGIGRSEVLNENYEASLPYFEQGLKILNQIDNKRWLAIGYSELGSAYYHLKEYEKSLDSYNKSLNMTTIEKWPQIDASNFANIGAVFMEQKKYHKALEYFNKSNTLSKRHGSINNQVIGYNDIASTYFLMGDYEKALKNYNSAIKLADSIGSIDNLSDNYKERSETYEKMGFTAKALSDYQKFHQLKDSVFNENKAEQIGNLKIQYETEKKEQQITLQEKEITVLEQQASISKLQKLLLGIGLLLSLIGFYAIRQKLKRNKLEKEKVDSELAFKKKELTTHALHLAKKNEVLESLKQKAQELKENEESKKGYQQLIRTINFDLQDDNNWENFARYFEEVHKDFNSNVKSKFPDVTSNELRLMALLKMNLSSKEIANILNISPEGIKKARYRLRKKLDITTEDSLQDLVLSL